MTDNLELLRRTFLNATCLLSLDQDKTDVYILQCFKNSPFAFPIFVEENSYSYIMNEDFKYYINSNVPVLRGNAGFNEFVYDTLAKNEYGKYLDDFLLFLLNQRFGWQNSLHSIVEFFDIAEQNGFSLKDAFLRDVMFDYFMGILAVNKTITGKYEVKSYPSVAYILKKVYAIYGEQGLDIDKFNPHMLGATLWCSYPAEEDDNDSFYKYYDDMRKILSFTRLNSAMVDIQKWESFLAMLNEYDEEGLNATCFNSMLENNVKILLSLPEKDFLLFGRSY